MALAQDNEAAKYGAISEGLAKTRLRCRLPSWRLDLAVLARLFLAWRRHRAEQRHLARLSDRDFKDIGLSRDDVMDPSLPSVWVR